MSLLPATLLVIEGNDQGTRFELTRDVVVGRGSKNPIRILDTEASRTHARIFWRESGWELEDLHSSNGTHINGQRVQSCQLESGDQIRMGRTLLLFALSQPQESSLVYVDLIGGSSQDGHSQIVRTFSPSDIKKDKSSPQIKQTDEKLKTADILRVMGDIAEQAVRPTMTMTELLGRVLRMILQTVIADRGCILLVDSETGMVVPQATLDRANLLNTSESSGARPDRTVVPIRMPISKTIVDYVLKTGKAVRTSDPLHDTRFDPGQSILQAGVKEALCVPMQGRMTLLGAIYLDVSDPHYILGAKAEKEAHLTDEQLRLLTAVARQCALAIENFRYQQSLVDAERLAAIGQTIATLSHHIKNILQGVRGGSYLIDMGLNSDDHDLIRKGWGLVERNQDKIYHLVMDMLTFSKERTPRIEMTDINGIVRDVMELMENRATEAAVKLVFLPGSNIPESSFDPDGLHRAVLNIVTNAIDAAEQKGEHGRVEVQTAFDTQTDTLSVIVADNGPGIPRAAQETIFNVFESTKGARGTGIGLPVSRKILREHGGNIRLESEPDAGAAFYLEWPYSVEMAESEHHRTISDHEGPTLAGD